MSGGPTVSAGGPVPTRPPFLAFANGAADQAALRAVAESHGWGAGNVYEGDIAVATEFLRLHPSPHVLLVELPSAEQAPALLDALADVCAPDVKVIAIGTVNEYSFFCWLTDLGISSYLLKPLNAQAIEGALARATQPAGGQAAKAKEPAQVISVMGTRGGVGATTVSAAVAMMAARWMNRNTVLADMDPHDGSVALAFDLEPSRGLRDALEKPDRIDSLFIDRVITRAAENLAIISAEESLADRVMYHPQAADTLIRELREKCDVLVIDLPRRLDDFTTQCLRHSAHVAVVTELTLAGLRDTLRLSDALREHVKIKPPVYAANRVGLAPKHEMMAAEFEKAAGVKFTAQLPFAPEQFVSLQGALPVVGAPDAKPHASLRTLTKALLPEIDFVEPDDAPKKSKFAFKLNLKKG